MNAVWLAVSVSCIGTFAFFLWVAIEICRVQKDEPRAARLVFPAIMLGTAAYLFAFVLWWLRPWGLGKESGLSFVATRREWLGF